ncbi:hypothetical protein JTE90_010141 [Oedothorax gibbosus]|uniref:Heme-binding protein 2 n=1 Tax=Oedothorax gibbosus TaxID=931172 RepID=A0AAV6UH07_9ARAC|nr:hypothetical protein JTE90_010141 [Oedothorax gibbosus]
MAALLAVLLFAATVVVGECCERHGAKCPDYTVVRKTEEYEERNYPSLVWASVSGNGKSKSDVSRTLIKQLYKYLGGENSKGQKLDMMVPVRTAKMVHEGSNKYIMSVALTQEQSVDPPVPSNPSIYVLREQPTTYVARNFSGMARQESIWDEHVQHLKTAVAADPSVDSSYYYICVYDSPWRSENRLNEVWMKKANN